MLIRVTRRIVIGAIIFVTLAMAGLSVMPVHAADSDLTDERAEQVRQNCRAAQSVMQRLQATDVATRISRGRVYENLLSKIIAPFNTRVGSNGYDATGLTALTGEMNTTFDSFKRDYQTYENSFSSLLKTDCENDPRGFYALLVTTRGYRQDLADDIAGMDGLLARYGASFDDLNATVTQKAGQ